MGKRSIRFSGLSISRQTYIGIFDVRFSLTGEFYRPFVSDLETATKDALALEIIKIAGLDNSERSRLIRLDRASLIRELVAVAGRRIAKMDAEPEFKEKFYAALPKRKAERRGCSTR